MTGPIFDFDDGDIIVPSGEDTGFDSQGHMHIRIGNNMSLDTHTGNINLTSPWKTSNSMWDDEED